MHYVDSLNRTTCSTGEQLPCRFYLTNEDGQAAPCTFTATDTAVLCHHRRDVHDVRPIKFAGCLRALARKDKAKKAKKNAVELEVFPVADALRVHSVASSSSAPSQDLYNYGGHRSEQDARVPRLDEDSPSLEAAPAVACCYDDDYRPSKRARIAEPEATQVSSSRDVAGPVSVHVLDLAPTRSTRRGPSPYSFHPWATSQYTWYPSSGAPSPATAPPLCRQPQVAQPAPTLKCQFTFNVPSFTSARYTFDTVYGRFVPLKRDEEGDCDGSDSEVEGHSD